ncbi:unnamed protein product [Rotaria socialis]|uniref:Uncharacterized protein n=3 Tax=Rotaria socialis TaxID=392032 RepID=A0A818UBG7_9BILA|nr:unnamed protein product [Rotaria socialis]CAF4803591.1 unnamed protein product [Rotaria socialis]
MDDDILIKFRQVTEIFKEKFQSKAIERHNEEYLQSLSDQLHQWKSNIDEQTRQIVEETIYEIQQLYDDYCQESDDKYNSLKEQIERHNSLSNIDNQIEDFNIYCQSNTVEKRIHLNTHNFNKETFDEKIQLENISSKDIPLERTIVPLKQGTREPRVFMHSIDTYASSGSSSQRKPVIQTSMESTASLHRSSGPTPIIVSLNIRPFIQEYTRPSPSQESMYPVHTSLGTSPERNESIHSTRTSSKSSAATISSERKPIVPERNESMDSIRTLLESLSSEIRLTAEEKGESLYSLHASSASSPERKPAVSERNESIHSTHTSSKSSAVIISPERKPIVPERNESMSSIHTSLQSLSPEIRLAPEGQGEPLYSLHASSASSLERKPAGSERNESIHNTHTSSKSSADTISPERKPIVPERNESMDSIHTSLESSSPEIKPTAEEKGESLYSLHISLGSSTEKEPVTEGIEKSLYPADLSSGSSSLERKSAIEEPDESRNSIHTSSKPSVMVISLEIKPVVPEQRESIHIIQSSPESSPEIIESQRKSSEENSKIWIKEDNNEPKSSGSGPKKELFVSSKSSNSTTPPNEMPRQSTNKLYVGRYDTFVPVLIHKNREVYNEKERLTEYCVNSIAISQDKLDEQKQEKQVTNEYVENDKDSSIKLVHAYRVLVEEENDFHPLPSDDEEDEEKEKSIVHRGFDLQRFNQIHYSTMVLKQCETANNCMSSSTKQNQLLVYNSKLNILIILKHEENKICRDQLFLQWPKGISSKISDITYCENSDQFLVSVLDTSHIYIFNPNLLCIHDLGKLSKDLPLRRIHCYQKTIYCILGNSFVLEFELNEQVSKLKFVRQIKLFAPNNRSEDKVHVLLDVTCDNEHLIIIYSNEKDEIHLQIINRQTGKFHNDFILDRPHPINKDYIRIESTNHQGNFIYLNGSHKNLKSINLSTNNKAHATSIFRRQKKPTNLSFLKDGRLVILYEHPYHLSIHDLSNH